MADNKIFVSPGVFTSEKDLTFISQQVGVTTLGVVGETLKGPAFEPIFISNYDEYVAIFGGLSPKLLGNDKPQYEASYIAKQYLTESNQLFVTRILGLTGYEAGSAWVIASEANYDPATVTTAGTSTFTASYSGDTAYGFDNAEAEYLYNTYGGFDTSLPATTGTTFAIPTIFDKVGTYFTGGSLTGIVTGLNLAATPISGTVSGTVITYVASAYTAYENKVLAMVRSRATVTSNQLFFNVDQSENGLQGDFTNALTNPLGSFALTAYTSGFTSSVVYDASLDSTQRNYLPRVVGSSCSDKDTEVWVEEIYPNMLANMVNNGYILGLKPQLLHFDTFNNYQQSYQTPETPWVVSELRGNKVDKLFKLVSISDGDMANQEIKISISRIDVETKTFDIIVRQFYDTDANPQILERFSKCSMDPSDSAFVAQRIGTADGEYALRSRYIMLVINPNAPTDAFPAGFEGYRVRDYDPTNSGEPNLLPPNLFYKESYDLTNDKLRKTYLGISNVKGIDQNMFNWKGYNGEKPTGVMWTAVTQGYHMDSGATIAGDFVVGEFAFRDTFSVEGTTYQNINACKFTFVPYLGFDGWNCNRENTRVPRTNTDTYRVGRAGFTAGLTSNEFDQISATEGTSDYYAYLSAIRTFANPESVNINVLVTPGVDYQDNLGLVDETIDMVEEERADSIYIVTSPDRYPSDNPTFDLSGLGFATPDVISAEEVVDILDNADLDSNYTATYWPWIQMRDRENSVNIFLPPTLEVVKDIALTDNISFPWFATAGYTRGRTEAIQPRIKLTEDMRDTLYEGRINPMAYFSDEGVLIWGNKNLQVRDSALDRLNIRRLLLQTRKLISAVAIRLLFEQNDQIVRNQFLSLVNPILDNIRKERGLTDFRVQLSNDPEEIDRNELRGKIFIKPIPSLEYIILEFNVTPTGASFDNL
jgi:hypothetical protein